MVDSVICCTLSPFAIDFLLHLVVLQGGLYVQVFYFQRLFLPSYAVIEALSEASIMNLRSWYFIVPSRLYFCFDILQVLSKLLLRSHLLPLFILGVSVQSCLHKFAPMLKLLSLSRFDVLVIRNHFLLAFYFLLVLLKEFIHFSASIVIQILLVDLISEVSCPMQRVAYIDLSQRIGGGGYGRSFTLLNHGRFLCLNCICALRWLIASIDYTW